MTRTEFERSVRQLRPEMLKVARSFFASPDDAEDAVQDALVRLWQYAERIDTRQNVAGLAVRVTKNCCVNLWRSRQKTDNQPSDGIDVSPHELLEADELRNALFKAVDQLTPRERELFTLRQWEGLSNDEIAQRTGIAKNSVKVMVSGARHKLIQLLRSFLES